MVKDSESKEKKAVRTLFLFSTPPFFGFVIKVFFNLLDDLIKCFLFKREIFLLGYSKNEHAKIINLFLFVWGCLN